MAKVIRTANYQGVKQRFENGLNDVCDNFYQVSVSSTSIFDNIHYVLVKNGKAVQVVYCLWHDGRYFQFFLLVPGSINDALKRAFENE